MKPQKILIFLLSVYLILFGIWFVFPSEGMKVGRASLRFPSYEKYLFDLRDSTLDVNVDSVLNAVQRSNEIPQGFEDSLKFFADYLHANPNRIYLPGDDYAFFDSLFCDMERAKESGNTVRILHYGDSQLEMDRISSVLRQKLQEHFGGSGPGFVPMIQRVPTVSLSQSAAGNLTRYAMVGDSLTRRMPTKRYGILTQAVKVTGQGSFTFRRTQNRYSQELVKNISKVTVLLGNNSRKMELSLKCDTLPVQKAVLDTASRGVSKVIWNLPGNVGKGSITFKGDAEIYGIALDGDSGVNVDNVALRGCSGSIFVNMDTLVMKESFGMLDTRLIIMQFGGNAMPGISSLKGISSYVKRIARQFDYFRKVAPESQLMFIGPADMCKSINGRLTSWPLLSQLNDSLRVTCLNNGVAYWDTFNVMGGAGAMIKWVKHNPALAGPDYIHFTSRGAERIGEALSKSFLLYYDLFRIRRDLSEDAVRSYIRTRRDSLAASLPDSLATAAGDSSGKASAPVRHLVVTKKIGTIRKDSITVRKRPVLTGKVSGLAVKDSLSDVKDSIRSAR